MVAVYRLTAKQGSSGSTTIWSTFHADTVEDAIMIAKEKLRSWEGSDKCRFLYARIKKQSTWVSVWWHEIMYLEPDDWAKEKEEE